MTSSRRSSSTSSAIVLDGSGDPSVSGAPLSADAASPADGVRDMVLSALFFSAMSLLVKLAGERIPALQIVLVRALLSLGLSWWFIRQAGLSWKGNRPRLLLLRGVFGLAGLICFFWAITLLDLADVTVLHYTNPLWTALLAALFLKERWTGRQTISLFLAVGGIILVAQPTALFGGVSRMPIEGVLLALGGAFFAGLAYVTVRKLGASEAPLVVVLYFPLVAVPLVTPFAIPVWVWPTALEWLILIGVGIATQVAQIFMTRGLAKLPAGRATTIGTLQVVFAGAWGWLVFGAFPNTWGIGGAILVVTAVIAGRPRRRDRAQAS